MKNKRKNHKWTKSDYILTFFVTKFGTSMFGTEKRISEMIGTSESSVKKMMSNFNHLLGKPNQLTHIKNLQYEVFSEYNNKCVGTYTQEVKSLTDWDNIQRQIILERMGVKNYRMIGQRVK